MEKISFVCLTILYHLAIELAQIKGTLSLIFLEICISDQMFNPTLHGLFWDKMN